VSAIAPDRGESDKIFLEGVRFYGHHGVTPAEQTVGAWFSVDVELSLNLTPAVLSDDLATAVDYSEVGRRIVEIGIKERCNLLERLGGMMAEALLREFPIREVRIRLRKLTAFMEGVPGVPGVELTRRR
jgi:dihydroneopterin aldolase